MRQHAAFVEPHCARHPLESLRAVLARRGPSRPWAEQCPRQRSSRAPSQRTAWPAVGFWRASGKHSLGLKTFTPQRLESETGCEEMCDEEMSAHECQQREGCQPCSGLAGPWAAQFQVSKKQHVFKAKQCNNQSIKRRGGPSKLLSITCGCALLLDQCAANLARAACLAFCNRMHFFDLQHATHLPGAASEWRQRR